MATIKYEDLEELARILIEKIEEEFETKHLSRNLVNTLRIEATPEKIRVIIPAQTYNMLLFQTKGVVVHTGHGSYASKLDKEGSEFYVYPKGTRKGSYKISPRNHKGYIDKVVDKAIAEWTAKIHKFKVDKITELGE